MIPAQYDFEVWKGSDYDLIIGLPINLQSFSATFVYLDDGVEIEIPATLVEFTTNPVEWEFRVKIPANVTSTFTLGIKVSYYIKIYNQTDTKVYFHGKISPLGIL